MASNDQFTDEEWPFGEARLGKRHKDDVCKWVRATEYNKGRGKPRLYEDGLDAKDISQGSSGTCYLLAAMATIAHQHPDLLKKMFLKHDIDKGIFMIKFYGSTYKGEKECVVLLDDYLPLGTWSGGEPANFLAFNRPYGYRANRSKNVDMELWATLLEAAYVKINSSDPNRCGTFEENYGGFSDEAVRYNNKKRCYLFSLFI